MPSWYQRRRIVIRASTSGPPGLLFSSASAKTATTFGSSSSGGGTKASSARLPAPAPLKCGTRIVIVAPEPVCGRSVKPEPSSAKARPVRRVGLGAPGSSIVSVAGSSRRSPFGAKRTAPASETNGALPRPATGVMLIVVGSSNAAGGTSSR
mgnify:CR=1 FL=1